ncbi:MAG TPA: hypothetical protein P5270_06850 [Victivallales bacterium]|nr:hypothetical protein [Victivallales bacterium]
MNELIIPKDQAISKMEAIKAFQEIVKEQLKEGEDYGRVPGVQKPFLFKSGAEKILSILGVVYDEPEYTETWGKVEVEGIEIPYYEVVCKVKARVNGEIVGFGVGSCNSLEKKYCYKDKTFQTDPIHYYSLKNTILKMAEKKAKVDLALHIGALSNIFTQDEDNVEPETEQTSTTKNAPTKKQIGFLFKLLEEKKAYTELVKKAVQVAKVRVEKGADNTDIVKVDGSFKEVSEAIDILTKANTENE